MSEHTEEPTREGAVRAEPFMVVDRINQEFITQKLKAAIEQLDIIAAAIREDGASPTLSLVYVNTVNARGYVEGALKLLPWAPLLPEDRRRGAIPPAPPG